MSYYYLKIIVYDSINKNECSFPIFKLVMNTRFGTGVLNGFEKINIKQPTITHIFTPYPKSILVLSKQLKLSVYT